MATKIGRISVAVDDVLHENLRKIAEKEGMTVSEVIRNAISTFIGLEGIKISADEIKMYSKLLSGREHLIIDTETWVIILDELNKNASDEFWKVIEKIGYEHGVEIKIKGCGCLEEALKMLDVKNLVRVKSEKNVHTLVLTARNEHKFLKEFLSGLCEALGIEVEIIEGLRKLVLIEKGEKD